MITRASNKSDSKADNNIDLTKTKKIKNSINFNKQTVKIDNKPNLDKTKKIDSNRVKLNSVNKPKNSTVNKSKSSDGDKHRRAILADKNGSKTKTIVDIDKIEIKTDIRDDLTKTNRIDSNYLNLTNTIPINSNYLNSNIIRKKKPALFKTDDVSNLNVTADDSENKLNDRIESIKENNTNLIEINRKCNFNEYNTNLIGINQKCNFDENNTNTDLNNRAETALNRLNEMAWLFLQKDEKKIRVENFAQLIRTMGLFPSLDDLNTVNELINPYGRNCLNLSEIVKSIYFFVNIIMVKSLDSLADNLIFLRNSDGQVEFSQLFNALSFHGERLTQQELDWLNQELKVRLNLKQHLDQIDYHELMEFFYDFYLPE